MKTEDTIETKDEPMQIDKKDGRINQRVPGDVEKQWKEQAKKRGIKESELFPVALYLLAQDSILDENANSYEQKKDVIQTFNQMIELYCTTLDQRDRCTERAEEKVKEQISRLTNIVLQKEQKIDELNTKVSDYEPLLEKANKLNEKNQKLKTMIAEFQLQLKNSGENEATIKKLQRKIDYLEKELEEEKFKAKTLVLETKEKSIADSQSLILTNAELTSKYENIKDEMKKNKTSFDEELRALKSKYSDRCAELKEQVNQLKREKNELQTLCDELNSKRTTTIVARVPRGRR